MEKFNGITSIAKMKFDSFISSPPDIKDGQVIIITDKNFSFYDTKKAGDTTAKRYVDYRKISDKWLIRDGIDDTLVFEFINE